MNNLVDILGQIEKLAYSLAVWVILIPKTIFKIVVEPGWVRKYIAQEIPKDKLRFDDYISPVILLLLCSLVPFI